MYVQAGVLQEVEEIVQQYVQSAQGHRYVHRHFPFQLTDKLPQIVRSRSGPSSKLTMSLMYH